VVIREFEQYKNDEAFNRVFNDLMNGRETATNVNMHDFAAKIVALHKSINSHAKSPQASSLRLN
jgi:hypothetical protein